MSKFRKGEKESSPGVNTASLPDIVFMLLFFFMVATTTKESDPTVELTPPKGIRTTDMTPYKQRSEIDFLYLGVPRNKARAEEFELGFALFLDNVEQPTPGELYNTNYIQKWKTDKYSEKRTKGVNKEIKDIVTCVKADKAAPSGILFDIRTELEKIDALTIAYAVQDNSNN